MWPFLLKFLGGASERWCLNGDGEAAGRYGGGGGGRRKVSSSD